MRVVIQRVVESRVTVDDETVGSIKRGLLVLLGVGTEDSVEDAAYLAEKTAHLRIFEDSGGKMNLSLMEIGGSVLAVSQFTLYGDCRKGRRPSFTSAAPPAKGEHLYQEYCCLLRAMGVTVEQGRFGANMQVELINDGPVTILLDSKQER
jgi:D-tyrosyl-tRNA(Tyr) deacylase